MSYLTNKTSSNICAAFIGSCIFAFVFIFGFTSAWAAEPANLSARQLTLAGSPITLTADQVYVPGSRNPLQRLDIYAPAKLGTEPAPSASTGLATTPKTMLAKKLPVILYIHGGSFCLGDKVSSVTTMPQVFTSKGFVFVSVDYRLSPAVHFPAHVQDVASAIAWIHRSIGRYGGDPNRIFLLGHSAGAQLAALVSTDQRYLLRHGLSLKTVSGVVLLDGGALDVAASLLTDKRRPVKSPAFGSNPAVWRQASPIYHVKEGKNIPPFLIYYLPWTIQSTEQNTKLISALRRARVPFDVHVIENKNHREINEALGNDNDPEGEQIIRFFNRLSQPRP